MLLSTVLSALGHAAPANATPLKIAFVGSTSVAGFGSSEGHHIPDELGRSLGDGFDVRGFGVQRATALKGGELAYRSTPQMSDALAFDPDVVIFWFGGVESWADNWNAHKHELQADYVSLVRAFQALPTKPQTFLIRLWVFKEGPSQTAVIDKEIIPLIDRVAAETGSTVIDYRSFMQGHPE
jgi:hypothetical protein